MDVWCDPERRADGDVQRIRGGVLCSMCTMPSHPECFVLSWIGVSKLHSAFRSDPDTAATAAGAAAVSHRVSMHSLWQRDTKFERARRNHHTRSYQPYMGQLPLFAV